LIPLFFGIQQFLEGFIWLSITGGHLIVTKTIAYAYLFFAFAFWPVYMPVAVFLAEKKEKAFIKGILFTLIIIGILVALVCYVPLFLGMTTFYVTVINHSIAYITNRSILLDTLLLALYLFSIVTPLLLVSEAQMKILGVLLLVSIVITFFFYRYAFYSVWCFFAAVLSLYIANTIYLLPHVKVKK
jgi:hypothetical protein